MKPSAAVLNDTRRFRPYPAYKDSGVEWLGEIPAHWEVYPLRRKLFRQAASIKIGPFGSQLKLEFMTQEGFKVYGQEHVIARDFDRGSKYVDQAKFAELSACEIRAGDLVITMMGSSGRCAVVPEGIEPGVMDSHLLRIRLPDADVDARFVCLLIDESDYVGDQIGASGKGAIMHGLNSGIIKSILLAVPPTFEQLKILAFLDRETARIDALVAKKERLIELLQEKRSALISRAVTKGLDPNVPMKDSGVEWLGEIPAHWEVMRIRDIADSLQTGPFGSQLHADEYVPGGYPVMNPANLQDGQPVPDWDCTVDENTARRLQRHRLTAGDILFARRGELGRCGLATEQHEGWLCGTGSLRLRLRRDLAGPRFVLHLLSTSGVRDWLRLQSIGATMENLNTGIIGRIPVALPTRQEQDAIVTRIDREAKRSEAVLATIRSAIDRLKELRTALISAAVTGKIDVRNHVMPDRVEA